MKTAAGVLALLVGITASVVGATQYFAEKAELDEAKASLRNDLDLVAMRLEQKIQADRAERIQERIWSLEDRNWPYRNVEEWDKPDRDEYRRLQLELKELEGRGGRVP